MTRFHRFLKGALAAPLAVLLVVAASQSCANTKQGPIGGPKDTIPPVIVGINPDMPMLNFPVQKGKIYVTFNEYVQLKNQYQEIVLSPPTKKRPVAKIKKKSVVVSFDDTLRADQTYSIAFGNAISDVNEGNPFNGYVINFSTGESIDSLILSGTVMDYATLLPLKGVYVALYKNPTDSCVVKDLADAATRSDDWGYFCFRGLKNVPYTIFAWEDKNNNQLYDRGGELAGFCDSTITPTIVAKNGMPQIAMMNMKDTLACLSRPSQTDIYLFKEKLSNQYIESSGRISERECYIKFRSENPQIDTFRIKGIYDDRIIRQLDPKGDSLTFWINDPKATQDTLLLRINYMKSDSTGTLKPYGETIKLVKPFDKSKIKDSGKQDPSKSGLTNDYLSNLGRAGKNDRRDPFANNNDGKKQAGNEVEKQGEKPEQRKDLLNVTVKVDGKTVENMGIDITVPAPLVKTDFDSIMFTTSTPRKIVSNVRFHVERDTTNILHYILKADDPYKVGNDYKLKIPMALFKDVNGFTNDSIIKTFNLPTDDKLSSITLEISGTQGKKYIVELVNEKRDKVYLKYDISSDRELKFPYLNEGIYSFRITQDLNGNGKLDVGDIILRKLPEKARLLKLPDGKAIINLKEQTDITQSVDLIKLFE
ncbi:MAG: Ig-like domain-containing protein [Bacteroidales bacterium]|nr:Ig-like domain-containing protein [Bacteroidales bacterium]